MQKKPFADIQQNLIQQITDIVPENQSVVDVLADLLQISTDSVYRRMRGETELNVQEVAQICDYFKLSFDSLCSTSEIDTVSFRYKPLKTELDYMNYLKSILMDMKKIAGAENGKIIYAAEDIPLFHHFRSPDLAAFKIFYWIRFIIGDEKYKDAKFSSEAISDEIKALCEEIFNVYSEIPSVEIWTNVTSASLVLQLRYFWDLGIFKSNEDALQICQLALEEIEFIQKQAEASCKLNIQGEVKLPEVEYTLYHSDIEIGNNTIMVTVEEHDWLYLTHNTLNKMVTANKEFCMETKRWLKYIMQKSTLLSGVAEKQRYQFFKGISDEVHKIMEEIQKT